MHWALTSGHSQIVSFLIENGADIFATNDKKYTTLHIAAENGSTDAVDILLEKAGDDKTKLFEAKNCDGKTPLELAKEEKNKMVVKALKSATQDNGSGSCMCIIS